MVEETKAGKVAKAISEDSKDSLSERSGAFDSQETPSVRSNASLGDDLSEASGISSSDKEENKKEPI